MQTKKRKLKPLFKHQLLVTCLSVALVVIATIASSYAIFSKTKKNDEYNKISVGELELSYVDLSEEGNVLQLANEFPVSDAVGEISTAYRFSVENTGSIKAIYKIKIIDDTSVIETDGCSENLLSRKNIRYKFDNNENGDLSDLEENDNIVYESSLNPGESNIHEIRLWISDESGNEVLGKHFHGKVQVDIEQNKVFCEYDNGTTWEFNGKVGIQEFIAPCSGTYKLETWGAKGNDARHSSATVTGIGGSGGYSVGEINLNINTQLFIVTGVANYNGGGTVTSSSGGSGGGATHIAYTTGTLAEIGYEEAITNQKLLIVAGGGGGAGSFYGESYLGGAGGGLSGKGSNCPYSGSYAGGAGTQTAGGSGGGGTNSGSFGQGGNMNIAGTGGAGGGGLFGGGGSREYCGGAGGSGYVSSLLKNASTTEGVWQSTYGKAIITLVSA